MSAFFFYFALLSLVSTLFLALLLTLKYLRHKRWIKSVFFSSNVDILKEQDTRVSFEMKLTQAGLTKKEFHQIVALSVVAGLSVSSLPFILHLSSIATFAIITISLATAAAMPFIYLEEQKKARIKRIEHDLAIFIDLLIIILEGGGGLHNAIDQVTEEAKNVIGKDLLEESRRFKYEFVTYDSEIAYQNLINRTGSEAIATIVGFMRLSQETGIGVKTIFENQSNEIKEADMLGIEKKASLMNVAITFTMFIFILPAIIAMITFPIAAGALMSFNF